MLERLVAEIDVSVVQNLTPAAPIIAAGALAAMSPSHTLRKALMLIAPALALALWVRAEIGNHGVITVAGLELITYRYDGLSRVFGLAFILAAFLNGLYALHERSRLQDAAALLYAGAGVGAVFAGDLATLFLFWELAAIASVFLVWAGKSRAAVNAGLRYLAIQVGSGMLLLTGLALHYVATGSLVFETLNPRAPGGLLILLAFGVKCAFPLLHPWLQDAYPKATAVGAVVLSAFTTKMAVYALARGFPGYEPLVVIGVVMTLFPIFFAVIENDLRRVLAYSINNQLGFMVCGVGLAVPGAVGDMALNGAAAHAFVHIIYKSLLFMSMGAVLHRVGTVKATELGGLYKTMPLTAVLCMIGAASISAVPLFSGFVAKALILASAAEQGRWLVWLALLFASAGVLEHAGIKVPFFAFFGHDSGKRPAEAPGNMLWAMLIAAFICIYIGVRPELLYGLLPSRVDFQPYTIDHVITQTQLVLAASFAFVLLYRLGFYPPERRVTILDVDWIYRRAGADLVGWLKAAAERLAALAQAGAGAAARAIGRRLRAVFAPTGALSRAVPSGAAAVWTVVLLGAALLVSFLAQP